MQDSSKLCVCTYESQPLHKHFLSVPKLNHYTEQKCSHSFWHCAWGSPTIQQLQEHLGPQSPAVWTCMVLYGPNQQQKQEQGQSAPVESLLQKRKTLLSRTMKMWPWAQDWQPALSPPAFSSFIITHTDWSSSKTAKSHQRGSLTAPSQVGKRSQLFQEMRSRAVYEETFHQ